eukprot:scaffold78322_cov15-Phaeocystis_antarctica.AAC.1
MGRARHGALRPPRRKDCRSAVAWPHVVVNGGNTCVWSVCVCGVARLGGSDPGKSDVAQARRAS